VRITLLNPLIPGTIQVHRLKTGHLGLAYVAASLRSAGHDLRIIDAKVEELELDEIMARVKEHRPSIFGSTAMTHEICEAARVCAAVKRWDPTCVTVVGGPHGTALPERTLEEFPGVDAVIIGEGERSICELADAVSASPKRSDWRSIAGIAFRDGEQIHTTDPRPLITDLDALPFPAWGLFPEQFAKPQVMASRGCPYRCAFCQRVLGGKVRLRSVDSVLAELDWLEERFGTRKHWFVDETFGVNRKWTNELLDKMQQRNARKGYIWKWGANSRVDLANEDLYRRMKEAGCLKLDFGVESGSQAMLDKIQKGITLQRVREAIAAANRVGLRTNAFFIIGHPGETWRTALQTVRFAPRSGAKHIAVGLMVPYPGTEIWRMARNGEGGYRLLTEDWQAYDKYFGNALELRSLSHRQLEFLQVLTYVWFYVRRGRFLDLLRFVRKFSRQAWAMIRRLIPKKRVPLAEREPE